MNEETAPAPPPAPAAADDALAQPGAASCLLAGALTATGVWILPVDWFLGGMFALLGFAWLVGWWRARPASLLATTRPGLTERVAAVLVLATVPAALLAAGMRAEPAWLMLGLVLAVGLAQALLRRKPRLAAILAGGAYAMAMVGWYAYTRQGHSPDDLEQVLSVVVYGVLFGAPAGFVAGLLLATLAAAISRLRRRSPAPA